MIGEDELKQSLQCSMRPDVGIANDYRCDADIAMKVVRLGIVERSCIITSRQSSQLLMHLQFVLRVNEILLTSGVPNDECK